MQSVNIVIIGGGPAGMAAALSAYNAGERDILILERDNALGGILRQCIHNGFGLHRFGKELTGPEYAWQDASAIEAQGIPYLLNTMVMDITSDKIITAMNAERGIFQIQAKAVILAMGCRERSRGALSLPGSRPAGIYTAGTAQRYVNMKGKLPGKKVVILGSGDIGLIMARRMTLEGAEVKAVCELMPYSGGLTRNIVQCLEDFSIPLKLSHTVAEIHGTDRITGVTIAKVDERLRVIPTETEYIPCDTLLLSCGLIPENELSRKMELPLDQVTNGAIVNEYRETEFPGIFACGNVLHVHDLVDYVSEEAQLAGASAAKYVQGSLPVIKEPFSLTLGEGVRYTVPQLLRKGGTEKIKLYFRVGKIYNNVKLVIRTGEQVIYSAKKLKMAPGEMEYISLTPEMIEKMDNTTVIAVEEAEA